MVCTHKHVVYVTVASVTPEWLIWLKASHTVLILESLSKLLNMYVFAGANCSLFVSFLHMKTIFLAEADFFMHAEPGLILMVRGSVEIDTYTTLTIAIVQCHVIHLHIMCVRNMHIYVYYSMVYLLMHLA